MLLLRYSKELKCTNIALNIGILIDDKEENTILDHLVPFQLGSSWACDRNSMGYIYR